MANSQSILSQDDKTGSQRQASTIKIAFLDVGQGDTIVISCTDTREAIVVDCVDARAVLHYLKQEQIKYLRGVIITHLHADHYKGVADLLNNCSVFLDIEGCEVLASNDTNSPKNLQKLIKSDGDHHDSAYEEAIIESKKQPPTYLAKLFQWCQQNKLKCEPIRRTQQKLPFNGTLVKNLDIVHPYHADYDTLKTLGLNNTSVVLRITGSHSSALLTGDLEPRGWEQLLRNNPELQSDVLKFPHHGGAWNEAETDALLDTVQPSTVVLSVGTEGEKYKHPNADVFTALSKHPSIRVLCTQATNQCQESVLNERDSIISKFQSEAFKNSYQLILSKHTHSCPCAGTIVIELSDSVRVLQPEFTFHQQSIIKAHFSRHKCTFKC